MRISDWSSDVCSSDLLVEVVDRHRAEKFLRRRIDRDDPDSLEKIGIVAVHTARRRGSISANQRADKYDVAHGGGRPYRDQIFHRGGKGGVIRLKDRQSFCLAVENLDDGRTVFFAKVAGIDGALKIIEVRRCFGRSR